MNVIRSSRTVDDVASLQQMQDIFSNQGGQLQLHQADEEEEPRRTGYDKCCGTHIIQSTKYVHIVYFFYFFSSSSTIREGDP